MTIRGPFDYFKGGDWNAWCDICGAKFKASLLKKRWDGLMCDEKCWEPRQPQDFVRGVKDQQAVPWSRPEGDIQYIDSGSVTPEDL